MGTHNLTNQVFDSNTFTKMNNNSNEPDYGTSQRKRDEIVYKDEKQNIYVNVSPPSTSSVRRSIQRYANWLLFFLLLFVSYGIYGYLEQKLPSGSLSPLAIKMRAKLDKEIFNGYFEGERKHFVYECLQDNAKWENEVESNHPAELKSSLSEVFHDFIADKEYKEKYFTLLYGPPGTGKTQLVKWLLNNAKKTTGEDVALFYVTPGGFMSKYYGGPEEKINDLFAAAKALAPSVVIIDEIDVMFPKRTKVDDIHYKTLATGLIAKFDGIIPLGQVMVIGATNIPHDMDDAALRRFEHVVLIDNPNSESRRTMIERAIHLWRNEVPESRSLTTYSKELHGEELDEIMDKIINFTEGMSRDDLDKAMKRFFKQQKKNNVVVFDPREMLDHLTQAGEVKKGRDYEYEIALKNFKSKNLRDVVYSTTTTTTTTTTSVATSSSRLRAD